MDPVTMPVTPVEQKQAEEKIGRWSENEHQIFLDGLSTHGKQWKTISTMIGTRTVVQVRTHAQKYFQKLERKNRNKTTSSQGVSVTTHTKPSKRKSLPASLPSRKKAKGPVPSKPTVSRTASLSLVNVNHAPPPSELQAAYVSTSSLSTGNWSTDSPTGVNEIEFQNSSTTTTGGAKEDYYLVESTPCDVAVPTAVMETTDDPLDWLIDGGFGHLPESSLGQPPMFPDFSDLSSDHHVLEIPIEDAGTEEPSCLNKTKPFDTSVLPEIPDPKVTVQSLFLDDGDAHLL